MLFTNFFIFTINEFTFTNYYQSFLNLNLNYSTSINFIFNQLLLDYNINLINKDLTVLTKTNMLFLLNYNFIIVWTLLKYSLVAYFLVYTIVYGFFNTNILTSLQNSAISKFLHIVESEEELGSLDDSFTLIFLFLIVFGWFFFLSINSAYFFNNQLTLISIGVIVLISFILLTPLSTLLDFGISFTTYIRGASAGSNLLVECVFDIIGTLVVFTRFVVQNIRFVLIFFAYFELFEWTYNSTLIQNILGTLNLNIKISLETFVNLISLDATNFFLFFSLIITAIISYLYYLVHLLILIFVQVTIYLLISFWLFFFFYTSFTLNKTEKLFILKK